MDSYVRDTLTPQKIDYAVILWHYVKMITKQEQITRATIKLFSSDGIAVPTAKIAEEAGVSNGTLFNYFSTKKELYNDLYLLIKEDMAPQVLRGLSPDLSTKDTLFGAWRGYANWANDNPLRKQAYVLLKTSHVLSQETIDKTDEMFQFFYDKMEQGVNDGVLKDIAPHYLCELAVAHLNASLAYAEAQQMNEVGFEHHVKASFDMFWAGVKA